MKNWMYGALVMLTLVLSGCDDIYNHRINVVYDGHGKTITFYDAKLKPIGSFEAETEIKISNDQNSVSEGYVRLDSPLINTLVESSAVKTRTITVKKIRDGEFEKVPSFVDKLEQAGSSLSAKVFAIVDEMHYYKTDFNGIVWTIIMILAAFAGWGLIALGTNVDSYLVALIGVFAMTLAYFSGYVLYGIQEPFDDGLKSGAGWFVDLFFFLGVVTAAIIMFSTFSTTMSTIVPYTMDGDLSMAGANTIIQWLLLFVYGLSLWLIKSIADYVLWAMIIVQIIFSLYIIVMSFKSLIVIPPLLYVILFPLCFIMMAISVLTIGWMVFVLVLMIVGFGSLLSQPNTGNGEVIGIKVTDGMGITLFENRWK
ncbi:MAG: hypothetical protein NC388_08740 [Clostridium sp.]|nr:hypothetical protein [Clostridium sp.]